MQYVVDVVCIRKELVCNGEQEMKCSRCSGEAVLIRKQDWEKIECLECGFEELKWYVKNVNQKM